MGLDSEPPPCAGAEGAEGALLCGTFSAPFLEQGLGGCGAGVSVSLGFKKEVSEDQILKTLMYC